MESIQNLVTERAGRKILDGDFDTCDIERTPDSLPVEICFVPSLYSKKYSKKNVLLHP